MDLSTVLGVALAWLFVGTAIYLGADGKAAALIDPTSFLVVLGGCTAATMAAFPFSDLKRLPKVLMKTVFWKAVDVQEVIDQEDKTKPYSDDELVRQLKKHGLNVARRTITKYRRKMSIPSSRQRRDWSKIEDAKASAGEAVIRET